MKNLIVIFILTFTGGLVSAEEKLTPDKELTYKTIGETKLQLHLFQPEDFKATDQRPCIICFFGGGWNGGTPSQFYQYCDRFAKLGMVAFSAEYRVAKKHKTTPFECVEDGKSAVRWVRENAKKLGVNPDLIVAAGGSAGGHVAACTALITGQEAKDEDLNISSIPNALILYNPVIDTTKKGYGHKRFEENRKTEISPVHHVRKDLPPTLITHGTADTTVPYENATRFTELMQKAGNDCKLITFEEKGHGFFNGSHFRKANGDDDFNSLMISGEKFLIKHKILGSQ